MEETEYLILRQTPYQESSLIVSGISPDFGRLDFLLKGSRSSGPKKFPQSGLFRELHVMFRPGQNSTLHSISSLELVRTFDEIALHTQSYLGICDFAVFLLKHLPFDLPSPDTFRACEILLERLSSGMAHEMPLLLARLAFAGESGLVPWPAGEKERELLTHLFAASKGEEKVPDLPEEYLRKLSVWIRTLRNSESYSGSRTSFR